MSALLLPNEILSMSAQAARRLVEAGDGDGALLYLALLEAGNDLDKARARLAWDGARLQQTQARLAQLGLARAPDNAPAAPGRRTARRNTPSGTLPTPWSERRPSGGCTGSWSGCWAASSPTAT